MSVTTTTAGFTTGGTTTLGGVTGGTAATIINVNQTAANTANSGGVSNTGNITGFNSVAVQQTQIGISVAAVSNNVSSVSVRH